MLEQDTDSLCNPQQVYKEHGCVGWKYEIVCENLNPAVLGKKTGICISHKHEQSNIFWEQQTID